jgi:hypothetical protein
MTARKDIPTLIAALHLAAEDYLDIALRQRHRDQEACSAALRSQACCMRLADELEDSLNIKAPDPETPALLRRQI